MLLSEKKLHVICVYFKLHYRYTVDRIIGKLSSARGIPRNCGRDRREPYKNKSTSGKSRIVYLSKEVSCSSASGINVFYL